MARGRGAAGLDSRGVEGVTASLEKMRSESVAEAAVETFRRYYEQLQGGDVGTLPESDIESVEELLDAEALPPDEAAASEALDRTVVLKLNGGLGTSMGLDGPKSLLQVKEGLSFLDIIVRQVLALRSSFGARLPLVLMNSFATRDETLAAVERYPDLAADVPIDFVQNKVPKLRADDLQPVTWPGNPELEWAPPGHGDLYTALVGSGMLQTLLERGYRYAFVSNSDNLGAVLEPRILTWLAREEIPFLMEVADRTEADRKGGHIARAPDGGLVLRESAQTPDEDMDAFQDVARHRYFNTNTLWVDLQALAAQLESQDGFLGLPMIANRKTVDPSDSSSTEVIQIETAMGAAIGVFDGAQAIRVPRQRFVPVKTTNDLLAVRSDAYVLTEASEVRLAPRRRESPPIVDLDGRFYKLVDDFEPRFPAGPPSLVDCDRLTVTGDVAFSRDVVVRGSVTLEHVGDEQLQLADGTVLEA
jgi:UTP--glucose-1-phosphate uridylyltransferase